MDILCPDCCQPMTYQANNQFKCNACLQTHAMIAVCPDCGKPLQKLQACGATDYFCNNGDGLISKKRVVWQCQD